MIFNYFQKILDKEGHFKIGIVFFFCVYKNLLYLCTAKKVDYSTVFAVE